jgi:tetratricopeptide (TPR) repeat protein
MEYRDTTKNLRQIAQELSVANVLEGSVQRAGERVRINVQLIDAYTDEHLWAEIYDRELTTNNLFDIQSEIAKAIAGALKATLTDSELADVADVPTENVAAYDLYLQARRFAHTETIRGYATAIDMFKESLALDPGFKQAWIGLARAHMTNYWIYGGDTLNRDLALEAIERARSIDAEFAELYMAEGFYWYWGFHDYERALYKLDKAIDMMPGNDEAYMWRGWVSRRAGLWDQAVVHFNWHEYALTLMYLHRYDEALSAVRQARVIDPDSYWGRTTEARILLAQKGDTDSTVKLTFGAQRGGDFNHFSTYMIVNTLARRFDDALAAARNLPDEAEIQQGIITFREDWAAQTLYHMGKSDEARQAAAAALFRLKSLRTELGEDYRMDLAEARIRALQGDSPETIKTLIEKSKSMAPVDQLAEFENGYIYAQIYAIAGMTAEAIGVLEPLLSPPSETSVYMVDLDPSFDAIRDDPEFKVMMKRNR